MSDLRSSLRGALVGHFGIDESTLADDTGLFSDGLLDSLSVMELVEFVESKSGLQIPPEDIVLENFDTVEGIVGYIERLKANRASP